MLFHGKWQLALTLICWCCVTIHAFYGGVDSGCSQAVNDLQLHSNVMSSWCLYQNPFASRQRFISDVSLFDDDKSKFKYVCHPSESGSKCTSVVSIRSYSDSMKEDFVPGGVLVLALITGEVFLYNTHLKMGLPLTDQYSDTAVEKRERFEMLNLTTMASVVRSNDSYYLETVVVQEMEPTLRRYYFDRDVRVVDMVLFATRSGIPVSANLVVSEVDKSAQVIFISFGQDFERVATWSVAIPVEHIGSLHMSHFSQKVDLPKHSPMNVRNVTAVTRNLIVLHTKELLAILEFNMNSQEDIQIDLQTATEVNSKYLFYRAHNMFEITAAVAMAENVRRPMDIGSRTSCSNVEYPLAQAVYLQIAEYNYDERKSRIITHHVPEFASYQFEEEEDCTLNPVQRPSKFDCSPGDYLDVSQSCKTPLQSSLEVDRKVLKLLTSFTDLNSTLGVSQTESYLANGELNPKAICESFTLYPYANNSNLNYTHCMQEIPNHKISCEYDLLASGLNEYLDSFYYLFWKNHIYAVSDDNIISVLTQTIKYDTPAGFKMTLANKLQTEGTIIDLHVSSNDQHLFASVERDEWVFESNQRFVEICNRLKEDPDNIFLKSFTRACDSYSPRDVSINDFALVSSSCADGVLCSSFNTPIINPHPRPGVFVYRSFIELECPKGSYCPGNGLKQSCPPGLLCDKIGMATPSICPYPLKGGSNKNGHPLEHTCFAEGLSQPMKTPPGTWSATAIFPPVFIPPGQFLLKIRNKHHEIKTIGVRDCKIGDYCGLGREVIIEEGETNLDELLCPPNTYCLDSSVIEPTICSSPNRSMDYCPIGSFSISKCPAGHYCPSPDKKFPCSPSQYCPSGSYLANICDAGYYCPNATVRIQCPEGYFCKAGARSPDRCTFFFSKCPPGSVQDSLTASGVVVIISLFGAILGCYIVYRVAAHVARKYHGRKREERKSKKMVAKAVSEQTPLSTSSSPITIGGSSIELHKPDYWVDIRFENLGLKLSNGQTVMSGVTGSIEHGKLTAVMGVSGAGKSTFISTLAGRAYYGTTVGKIFVNGKAVHSLNRFKNRIGFVPQDDIMIRECTVEETLYFSARTRLDKSKTLQEINDIVDNVIHVLQLEHVRHSIIGDEETRGISGGERKRVSVGIELVAQPIILFCDEPTSGLDSASSKEVCAALKSIAQSGITVVSVIHQPRYEIFEMFDTLLLLGKGGRTVYIGEVQKAQDYFEEIGYNFPPKVNPADYLMDITSGNVEAEVSSQVGSQFSLPVNAANLPGIWDSMTSMRVAVSELDSNEQESNQKYTRSSTSVLAQFWMCLQRSVIQQFRAITTVFLDCFLVLIAGLVVGLIYLNSRYKGPLAKEITDMCPSVLQPRCKMPLADPIAPEANLITVGMSLCGVMAALRVYGREKTVFKKEAQSGLSTFLYFWARDFSMIPNVLLGTLVFLAIYYALIAPLASVPIYFSAIVLTYWSAYGLGYVISIIISPQTAQLAAVVVIFVMNIFSGANPRLGEIYDMSFPMNIAPYFSFLSYSMELLYLNELWHYRKVYDVKLSLQGMGYHFSDFTYCWVGLLLQGLVLRCIAFSLLSLSKPNHFVYRLWSRVSSRIQLRRRLNIIKFWKRRNSEAYSSIQATA